MPKNNVHLRNYIHTRGSLGDTNKELNTQISLQYTT